MFVDFHRYVTSCKNLQKSLERILWKTSNSQTDISTDRQTYRQTQINYVKLSSPLLLSNNDETNEIREFWNNPPQPHDRHNFLLRIKRFV